MNDNFEIQFSKNFTIMAGPCMLESKEIGSETADFLKTECAKYNFQYVFKSSYDKANRTSKQGIRGPGLEQGLLWLSEIKNSFQVPILTDVHNPAQAAEAATVADIVQIPAFLSQWRPLLQAAASTNKWVQIKKGQHMHPADTVLAAKYLEHCGNPKAILCERGSSFGYNDLVVDYRGIYDWKQEKYPIIFDATHAAQLPGAGDGHSSGRREVVPSLIQAAVGLQIQGIFMEVHPNPEKAQSDASTQLNFKTAATILKNISSMLKTTTFLSLFINATLNLIPMVVVAAPDKATIIHTQPTTCNATIDTIISDFEKVQTVLANLCEAENEKLEKDIGFRCPKTFCSTNFKEGTTEVPKFVITTNWTRNMSQSTSAYPSFGSGGSSSGFPSGGGTYSSNSKSNSSSQGLVFSISLTLALGKTADTLTCDNPLSQASRDKLISEVLEISKQPDACSL
jgi:2-dehydro-3-deoxyphosphooctonate aldolase (KDO 8-P synthase)